MNKNIYNGLIGTVVVTLGGCGLSDPNTNTFNTSNNSNTSNTSNTSKPVTFNGTAAKGIINKGLVVAKELKIDGSVLAQVGNATTDITGSYNLTLGGNYSGGPIEVTISADPGTEMKCDVSTGCGTATDVTLDINNNGTVDFGEWYKLGTINMSALVASATAGDVVGVNITPYTHMATQRAKEAATLNSTAIFNANSEVSTLLGGINILTTKALDITDPTARQNASATEVSYAAFSAAIGILAPSTSSGAPNIDAALGKLADSFQGGTIAPSSTTTNSSLISMQDIITATEMTLAKTNTVDTSGILAAVQTTVTAAEAAGGNIDPHPSTSAGDTNIAKVKTFITDVRTWGTVINAEMSAKSDAFSTQVNLASSAANASQNFLVSSALNATIEAIMDKVSGNASSDLSTYTTGPLDSVTGASVSTSTPIPLDPQFSAGSIVQSGDNVTISGALIGGINVDMSLTLPAKNSALLAGSIMKVNILSANFTSANADVVIKSGSNISLNLSKDYIVDYATGTNPEISAASVNLDISLTQKKGQDQVTGNSVALDSAITFSGTLAATLGKSVTDTVTGNTAWVTPKNLTLAGNVSDATGNSLDAQFTVNITNADTFKPVGQLPIGTIKPNIATWNYTGNSFVFTSANGYDDVTIQWNSPTSTTFTYGGIWGYSYEVGSYANLSEAVNLNFYTPWNWENWIADEGLYFVDYGAADFSVSGSVSGRLIEPEFVIEGSAANQWLKGNLGLDFNLQLAGLPQASVNISGSRTDVSAGNASVTIAYGARQLMVTSDFTDTTTSAEVVTITNQDGVKLVIPLDIGASTGNITLNGVGYATVSQSNGLMKITYNDGTLSL